jgi:hypothetical protein
MVRQILIDLFDKTHLRWLEYVDLRKIVTYTLITYIRVNREQHVTRADKKVVMRSGAMGITSADSTERNRGIYHEPAHSTQGLGPGGP